MKRVLITRSSHQASELADRLRALDIEPILIPTIELTEPTTFTPLDDALTHLASFHWLLFTSANAVEAFHRRLTSATNEPVILSGDPERLQPNESVILSGGRSPQSKDPEGANSATTARHLSATNLLPSNLKIAAIGPATARALEAIGLHPDLIPPLAVAESFAESLLPHARQSDGATTRFLLIRAEAARDHLPDTLLAAGAEVTIAAAYRTVIPAESLAQIKQLFEDPHAWPDAITFTSSSTALNLQALLEASGLALPSRILRFSIGPITSQTLRDLSLPPHAEAEQPNLSALAATVVKTLHRQNTHNLMKTKP